MGEAIKSNHEKKHPGYQQLLKEAEAAERQDLQAHAKWENPEIDEEIKSDHENKHPGYHKLLKEAEEAEREDLEADTNWEKEKPRAEEEHEKSLEETDDQEAQKNLVGPDRQEL